MQSQPLFGSRIYMARHYQLPGVHVPTHVSAYKVFYLYGHCPRDSVLLASASLPAWALATGPIPTTGCLSSGVGPPHLENSISSTL